MKYSVVFTSADIRTLLINKLGYNFSQKDMAKKLGVSNSYLSDYLAGKREVGPTILKALGFSVVPRYERAKNVDIRPIHRSRS
jgi:transcriptional regulator with XRE-family HTH domain